MTNYETLIMEIFLEFLKYGAIGIAMVLAVLSYRLLSKEQEKEHVREPMLKSIRNYFLLSIILSLFFGVTEIATTLIPDSNSVTQVDTTKEKVNSLYQRQLKGQGDNNIDEKLSKIEYFVQRGVNSKYDSDGEALKNQLADAQKEIATLRAERYVNAVYALRDLVDADSLHFINIRHQPWNKERHYKLMYEILSHLSKIESAAKNQKELIRTSWEEFKKTYAFISDKNPSYYIVKSDIDELVKLGYN